MHESYESKQPVLVRCDRPMQEPSFETPSRRGRIFAIILLVCLVALSLYLFFHTSLLFRSFEYQFQAENNDVAKIRVYSQQLESLQDRMTGFIAGSVENKIRTLEKSIAAGAVGAQEIRTFEELKNELKLLETYSAGKGGKLTDQARLDHSRFQVVPGSAQSVPEGELLREIVKLKILFYLSIGSCSLMAALVGGCWWQNQRRAKRLQAPLSRAPLLAKNSSDEAS